MVDTERLGRFSRFLRRGVLLGAVTVAACGGRSGLSLEDDSSSVSSTDGGGGGVWGQSTGPGPWSPVCPETAPATGSACSTADAYCEYGEAWWDVSCDTVVQCLDGSWQPAAVSQQTCFPAPGPNSALCPGDPLAIPPGAACSHPGLACYYGQGAVCICGLPVGPDALDAGSEWACGPDPGCPGARPRLGAPCTGDSLCEYNDASGFAEVCQGGTWGVGNVGN